MKVVKHRIWNLRVDTIARCRDLLVASNRSPVLHAANRCLYPLMESAVRRQFRGVPEVRSIYVGHSLALGEVYPGLSDFDLFVVTESNGERAIPELLWRRWKSLRRYLPVRDITPLSTKEFAAWCRCGGGWEPRDEMRHWRLLHGEELRSGDWDLGSPRSERDRLRHALAGFQKLVHLALKEERRTPGFRVVARRQLYKAFCQAVLSLDREYLAIPSLRTRLRRWWAAHGEPAPVTEILRSREARFLSGPISSLQRSLAVFAYRYLTDRLGTLADSVLPRVRPLQPPELSLPVSNEAKIVQRIGRMIASVVDLVGEHLASVVLFSGGSCRGYQLGIILADDLNPPEIEEVLARLRVTFRIFDDPWFNEHFPEGVPMVCSRNMFQWYLKLWPSAEVYGRAHKNVLFGEDPYSGPPVAPVSELDELSVEQERRGEGASLARYIRQVYLHRTKPALYDVISLHIPRWVVFRERGVWPTTAEEAVACYENMRGGHQQSLPRYFLAGFEEMDIDTLAKVMDNTEFDRAWEFLAREFFAIDKAGTVAEAVSG